MTEYNELKSDESNNTVEILYNVDKMIEELNATNSTNGKIEILKNYNQLKPFLKLLMDPLQTTGVTRNKILDYEKKSNFALKLKSNPSDKTRNPSKSKLSQKTFNDLKELQPPTKKRKLNESTIKINPKFTSNIVEMIKRLYSREYSGHDAKEAIIYMMERYPQYRETILKISEKNLKTRTGVKQINAAFPNLIPEFTVALAEDFFKKKKYFDKHSNKNWFVSRKFDGVRVISIQDENNKFKCYSRNGSRFESLEPLEKLLESHIKIHKSGKFKNQPWVLDGEICVVDDNGNEDFSLAVSRIRRKNKHMENYRYHVFDMLTVDEFWSISSDDILSDRVERWEDVFGKKDKLLCNGKIKKVDQTLYEEKKFEKLVLYASENKWEGLMLRMDAKYKGKRSNDILKYKNFNTEEYKVIRTETGPMRIIDEQTGLEKTIETLKNVIIEHKNQEVSVGSGFTLQQRNQFYKHPDKIINKIISVQYFEESKDKTGKLSLRFPTFKFLYGDDRDC